MKIYESLINVRRTYAPFVKQAEVILKRTILQWLYDVASEISSFDKHPRSTPTQDLLEELNNNSFFMHHRIRFIFSTRDSLPRNFLFFPRGLTTRDRQIFFHITQYFLPDGSSYNNYIHQKYLDKDLQIFRQLLLHELTHREQEVKYPSTPVRKSLYRPTRKNIKTDTNISYDIYTHIPEEIMAFAQSFATYLIEKRKTLKPQILSILSSYIRVGKHHKGFKLLLRYTTEILLEYGWSRERIKKEMGRVFHEINTKGIIYGVERIE